MQPQFPLIAELIDADDHVRMTKSRLSTVSPEEAIPPRQVEAEVAICLAPVYRVVNPMHLRCDDNGA